MKKQHQVCFSVIVPTYNRVSQLQKTLISLSQIDYPKLFFEIIVVDNNSTDTTQNMIFQFRMNYPELHIRSIVETRRGPSFARNTGASFARNKHLVFVDDDVMVPVNVLLRLSQLINQYPNVAIIGGKVILDKSIHLGKYRVPLKNASWVLAISGFHYQDIQILHYPDMVYSAIMYLNKNEVRDNQFFNLSLGRIYNNIPIYGEDFELCLRMHLTNRMVIFDPSIVCIHNINMERLSYLYFFRRFLYCGIEVRIIDKILSPIYKNHKIFYPPYRLYGLILKKLIYGIEIDKILWRIIQEILFLVGYYIYYPFLNLGFERRH